MAKKLQKAQIGKQVPQGQDKGWDKATKEILKRVPKVNDPGYDKAIKEIRKKNPEFDKKKPTPFRQINPKTGGMYQKTGGTVKKRK